MKRFVTLVLDAEMLGFSMNMSLAESHVNPKARLKCSTKRSREEEVARRQDSMCARRDGSLVAHFWSGRKAARH